MIAAAGAGCHSREVEALCLAQDSPHKNQYRPGSWTCDAFARATHGAVDGPPNYGEIARALYAEEAEARHPNGAPMFAKDGTMLDEKGDRSIFDDVAL